MKTLIHKTNPSVRITAPEIEEDDRYYYVEGFYKEIEKYNWTLIKEEPEKTYEQGLADGYKRCMAGFLDTYNKIRNRQITAVEYDIKVSDELPTNPEETYKIQLAFYRYLAGEMSKEELTKTLKD